MTDVLSVVGVTLVVVGVVYLFFRYLNLMMDVSCKKHYAEVDAKTERVGVSDKPHFCPLCKEPILFRGPTSWRSTEVGTKDVIINEWWCPACNEQWRLVAWVGDYQVNYKPKVEAK